ncbi:hypothetical protein SCLCIDRAFT_7466 [Scleroderma citrinum Foug A]|uniref:Uncharacterized protein n=1 Tax=Scleroderma citrinum Foug A TaxID=1036808 RepID=A0A0C3A1D6_9AGAM|nr:hypothetical protein SCLCIDRAFT_7466 [Scleroderma citrinum Foug A]
MVRAMECHRDVADQYFNSNVWHKAPTGLCCNNCSCVKPPTQPQTPPSQTIQFIFKSGLSPNKSPRHNGKRPMVPSSEGLATRRDEHLESAKDLLVSWRYNMWMTEYADAVPYGAEALLPDAIIDKIASNWRLATLDDLGALGWSKSRAHCHGKVILKQLKELNVTVDANKKVVGHSVVKQPKEKQLCTPCSDSSNPSRPSTSHSKKAVLGPSAQNTISTSSVSHAALASVFTSMPQPPMASEPDDDGAKNPDCDFSCPISHYLPFHTPSLFSPPVVVPSQSTPSVPATTSSYDI